MSCFCVCYLKQAPAYSKESPAMGTGASKRLHVSNLAPQVTDGVLKVCMEEEKQSPRSSKDGVLCYAMHT